MVAKLLSVVAVLVGGFLEWHCIVSIPEGYTVDPATGKHSGLTELRIVVRRFFSAKNSGYMYRGELSAEQLDFSIDEKLASSKGCMRKRVASTKKEILRANLKISALENLPGKQGEVELLKDSIAQLIANQDPCSGCEKVDSCSDKERSVFWANPKMRVPSGTRTWDVVSATAGIVARLVEPQYPSTIKPLWAGISGCKSCAHATWVPIDDGDGVDPVTGVETISKDSDALRTVGLMEVKNTHRDTHATKVAQYSCSLDGSLQFGNNVCSHFAYKGGGWTPKVPFGGPASCMATSEVGEDPDSPDSLLASAGKGLSTVVVARGVYK